MTTYCVWAVEAQEDHGEDWANFWWGNTYLVDDNLTLEQAWKLADALADLFGSWYDEIRYDVAEHSDDEFSTPDYVSREGYYL